MIYSQVYARIRPLDVPESEKCIKMLDDTKLQVSSADVSTNHYCTIQFWFIHTVIHRVTFY